MPLGWAWPAPGPHDSTPQAAPASAPTQRGLPSELKLVGVGGYEALPFPHFVYRNATLTFGESRITADSIELYPEGTDTLRRGSGLAKGHVEVTDPVGLLSADNATFNWVDKTGDASEALITVDGMRVIAAKVHIEPGLWTLDAVRAELARGHPLAYFLAGHAVVRPGTGLRVYSADAHVIGTRIGGVRHFNYSVTRSLGGDIYPVPTYSGDRGLGVRYHPRYLLDDRTAVAGSFAVTQTAPPSYGVQFARSFLSAGEARGLVVPRSDLDMRFDFGWMDSVGIESPSDEHAQVSLPRDNVSVQSFVNVQAYDRKGSEVFVKPFEATIERSLELPRGAAVLSDTTFQHIHALGATDHDRFLNATTLEFPMLRLSPTLTIRPRLDAAAFVGSSTRFGWIHGQAGLVYRPNETWRFGAAFVGARETGSPLYLADDLYSLNSLAFRTDYAFGPHRVSLLAKYDTDRRRWYDREMFLGQSVGPLELFIRIRTFPSQLIFGGQLRVDSALNEILKRNPSRPKPAPKLPD
ncbi:MAG TPA: hypothetical protein VKT78_00040 [Fimbriimonadaceae bacterium]|nr:hypothetical protein [Fimbriimonadaceae bacterium]